MLINPRKYQTKVVSTNSGICCPFNIVSCLANSYLGPYTSRPSWRQAYNYVDRRLIGGLARLPVEYNTLFSFLATAS